MRRVSVLLALCLMFFGPSQSKADIYHYDGRGDVVGQTDSGGNLTYQAAYTADGVHNPATSLNFSGVAPGTWGAAESDLAGYDTGHNLQANTKREEVDAGEAGLVNDGYRDRSLLTGRYSVRDPSGFPDGGDPYLYVNNNPWSKTDSQGLFVSEIIDGAFFAWDLGSAGYYKVTNQKEKLALAEVSLAIDVGGMMIDVADVGTGGGTTAIVAARATAKAKYALQAASAVTHTVQAADQAAATTHAAMSGGTHK